MTGNYTVASGSVIRWRGGTIVGGSPVPEVLLAEWSEETLQANIDAGSVIAVEPIPAPSRKERKGKDGE